MRISASLFGVLFLLAACDGGADKGKSKAGQTDSKSAGDAKKDAKKSDAKKADAKPDDKPDAKKDGEAKDAPVDPAEEFAASRDEKTVEVTAKPGTPEWFVQGLQAFRAGDLDPIIENFAKDIVWDAVGSPIAPPSEGAEAVRSRWEDLLTGIPDMKLHARRIFHQGDLIAMQVVLTGSHKGNFRGLEPTNKPLGTEVLVWVWHDKDGKAKKVDVYYNEAALLAQMGVLGDAPAPAIPDIPAGDPEIITGEDDAAAKKTMKDLYAAGKGSWKLCQEKLCIEGVVGHDMAEGTTMKTPEEHAKAHDGFFAAFPDLKPKLDDSFAFGPEWVVVSMSAKATHKGDLGPLKATNKKVNLTYAELVHFQDGKIAETWGYSNNLDLLAQLGMFTPPEPTESSAGYESPPDVPDPDEEGDGGEQADDEGADAAEKK